MQKLRDDGLERSGVYILSRSPTMSFHLSDEMHERLKRYSREVQLHKSVVIRNALDEYLLNHAHIKPLAGIRQGE